MSYTNADGLYVLTFGDKGREVNQGVTVQSPRQAFVLDLSLTEVGATFGAANITPNLPFIPAGSVIVGATLYMTTAATSGGLATLTIGTYNAAGTAIVAAGIDSAIALTAIDAVGETVRCDGTHTTTAGYLSQNAYIGAIYGTAAFTAGVGKLIIEYIKA
jgi:hypothetical protein